MSYLLDTHALLWWLDGDPKLSAKARAVISDRELTVWVSAATAWEIANKARIGKLPHVLHEARHLLAVLAEQDFKLLPITAEHGLRAGWLPGEHKDPFDRMLAAQSIVEGLILVTTDKRMAGFGAKVMW